MYFQPHKHTRARAHTYTHFMGALSESHSTCLAGLPVANEEQKQAANAASASVQESCHCMHCNELLITLAVWGTNGELATLARNGVYMCVCFVFSMCLCCNHLRVCVWFKNPGQCWADVWRHVLLTSKQTVFHGSDNKMKQGGFRMRWRCIFLFSCLQGENARSQPWIMENIFCNSETGIHLIIMCWWAIHHPAIPKQTGPGI